MAGVPEPDPADLLSAAVDQLAGVIEDLRRHQAVLRSADPAHHTLELAQLRAEATTEVLAAQQIAAQAAQDASRASEHLAAERAEWDGQRAALDRELDSARSAAAADRERAASAEAALGASETAHRAELAERDRQLAATASAHESERTILANELDKALLAVAAGQARAESADQRATRAEAAAREAASRAEQAYADNNGFKVELAQAQGSVALATARAEAAERLLEEARADVRIERERYDARLAQLHDQVTQLAARRSPKRATPTKIREPAAKPRAAPHTGGRA